MRSPADVHTFEQLQARLADVARTVAQYRRALVDEGVPERCAWQSAQRVEAMLIEWTIGGAMARDLADLVEG